VQTQLRLSVLATAALLTGFATTPTVTTTKLVSSLNPSNSGQSVKLTATVAPSAATGSVAFMDGSTTLGSGSLTSGTATLTLANLSVAAHSLTAVYSGDSKYGGSTSAVLTQTVNPPMTTVTLKSSANPSSFGQNVTLSVTLSPSTATGTITFKDGSTALGTSDVSFGVASMAVSTLSIGTHTITASYGGDGQNPAGLSTALTQTVNQAKSTTTLSSSSNPSGTGQTVTLTATVSPATATGTVTFKEGTATLGTGDLGGGTATLVLSSLAVGKHTITATYGGTQATWGVFRRPLRKPLIRQRAHR
jgi:hypothetical protein